MVGGNGERWRVLDLVVETHLCFLLDEILDEYGRLLLELRRLTAAATTHHKDQIANTTTLTTCYSHACTAVVAARRAG